MKKAIVTRSDENIKAFSDISHPIFKHFCKEWDCDFIVLDGDSPCNIGNGKYHYRIMKMGELLDDYDRILHLDTDIILAPNCLNIFKVVSERCIGTLFEDVGTRKEDRRTRIRDCQNKWEDICWYEGYFNTGVFVVSKQHKDIFESYKGEYWVENGFDDVHLGFMARFKAHRIQPLQFRLNHMSMHSERWNHGSRRLDSYVIHYAGGGKFPGTHWQNVDRNLHIEKLMKSDKEKLWSQTNL
jgi:lipopolysaccharide biosynthesis glycosyltransferase